jgi:hypothetical protein
MMPQVTIEYKPHTFKFASAASKKGAVIILFSFTNDNLALIDRMELIKNSHRLRMERQP